MAWDRDRDVIYIYDCYKKSNETPVYHAHAIRQRGDWIPVSWPHDGMNREKRSGQVLKDEYVRLGVNMLSRSARYKNDVGGGQDQEPIVMEMLERMKTDRLKIFSNLNPLLEERRMFHRKDGRIVNIREDILKAVMYAIMMRRFAMPNARRVRGSLSQMPAALSARI